LCDVPISSTSSPEVGSGLGHSRVHFCVKPGFPTKPPQSRESARLTPEGTDHPERARTTRRGHGLPGEGTDYPERAQTTRRGHRLPGEGTDYPERARTTRRGHGLPGEGPDRKEAGPRAGFISLLSTTGNPRGPTAHGAAANRCCDSAIVTNASNPRDRIAAKTAPLTQRQSVPQITQGGCATRSADHSGGLRDPLGRSLGSG
jgi:hypothetical protein